MTKIRLMPHFKVIEGRTFEVHSRHKTKESAKKMASYLRRKKWKVRIFKREDGYYLYYRGK